MHLDVRATDIIFQGADLRNGSKFLSERRSLSTVVFRSPPKTLLHWYQLYLSLPLTKIFKFPAIPSRFKSILCLSNFRQRLPFPSIYLMIGAKVHLWSPDIFGESCSDRGRISWHRFEDWSELCPRWCYPHSCGSQSSCS